MSRSKSNRQVLNAISALGPVAEAFVFDAVGKMCNRILDMPFDRFKEAFGENPLVSAEEWYDAADDILSILKENRHA